MADNGMNWKRDILLIPIIVGVVVAIVTYGLPKLLETGKRLSFTVEAPVSYLQRGTIPGVSVTVHGVPAPNLTAQKVRLWNSGGAPLTNLGVTLRYAPTTAVRILSSTHATDPPAEFGKIEESIVSPGERRYVYALLNPTDADTLTILTDRPGTLRVFAKAEGLKVVEVEPKEKQRDWHTYANVGGAIVGTVASLFALLLKRASETHGGLWPFK